jgi:urease accessory protein
MYQGKITKFFAAGLGGLAGFGLAGTALAHPGGSLLGAGLAEGLAHPLLGLDHLLALLAVGLLAARLGGAAVWRLPLAVLAALTLGGLLVFAGIVLPAGELVIAASVLVLGLMVAAALRLPLGPASALAAVFALFHGQAHGAGLPLAASPVLYGLGILAASTALIALGFALGRLAARFAPAFWPSSEQSLG